MPFYTGTTADGSDIKEFEGVYVNPNNPNEWSSTPYPEQIKELNTRNEIYNYMDGKYCLNDVYKQIQNKTCPLSKRCRDMVLSCYDENGNWIEG